MAGFGPKKGDFDLKIALFCQISSLKNAAVLSLSPWNSARSSIACRKYYALSECTPKPLLHTDPPPPALTPIPNRHTVSSVTVPQGHYIWG